MLKGNIISAIQTAFTPGSGTLVSAAVGLPQGVPASGSFYSIDEIDSATYLIQTGTGVSAGAIGVSLLALSPSGAPVWIAATTPNSATGAAFTLIAALGASIVYNGSLNVSGSVFFPCLGIRLTVSGLTGGNITVAQINATVR